MSADCPAAAGEAAACRAAAAFGPAAGNPGGCGHLAAPHLWNSHLLSKHRSSLQLPQVQYFALSGVPCCWLPLMNLLCLSALSLLCFSIN